MPPFCARLSSEEIPGLRGPFREPHLCQGFGELQRRGLGGPALFGFLRPCSFVLTGEKTWLVQVGSHVGGTTKAAAVPGCADPLRM